MLQVILTFLASNDVNDLKCFQKNFIADNGHYHLQKPKIPYKLLINTQIEIEINKTRNIFFFQTKKKLSKIIRNEDRKRHLFLILSNKTQ